MCTSLRSWQTEALRELFGSTPIVWVIAPSMSGKTWFADFLRRTMSAVTYRSITPDIVDNFWTPNIGTSQYVIAFDVDRPENVDLPSLMKLADGSAFTIEKRRRPGVIYLATFEPPEGLGEMECLTMTAKNFES